MRVWAVLLAVCLLPVGFPPTARAAACPSSRAKLAADPKFDVPQPAKITSKVITFEIDVGSDGRVRGLHLDHSSGDGAVDLSIAQTLQAASYIPAQTGCVAYSSALVLVQGLPGDNLPDPTPPPKLDTTCTPFIHAFLTPNPRDRKRTGTAKVDIELDAAGTARGAPALKESTGSPVLDAEAVRIAKTAQYGFETGGPCAPQPFTYELELTFQ